MTLSVWLALPDLRARAARRLLPHPPERCTACFTRLYSAGRRCAADLQNRIHRFLTCSVKVITGEEKGQALVEEALILALIAILGLGALSVLQGHVVDAVHSMAANLGVLEPVAKRGGN